MPQLILASGSRFRRELMNRIGVSFEAHPHRCDESEVMTSGMDPTDISRTLSHAKAASLASAFPEAYIIGSDQVVDLDGEVLGKPQTERGAVEQLQRLRGRHHRLITGVCLRSPSGETDFSLDVHKMRIRDLDDQAIENYVRRDMPVDCAGSYKAEGLGIALFEAIDGVDFTAIVGLPMITVCDMLQRAGFRVL